jgi:TetR/AcrR family transcriptional repressor of nem operon
MIDLIAEQIPDVPHKAARRQASATLATMIGALVLSRVAGNGAFSEDILSAGREAALNGAGARKTAAKKPPRPASVRH